MNKLLIFSLLALLLIGGIVSRIKYEVVFLKDQLKNVNSKIEQYTDDLKVYNAEWSYLNSPARLKKLCEKYLKNLSPTENKQIISYQTILNSNLSSNSSSAFSEFLDNSLKNEKRRGN